MTRSPEEILEEWLVIEAQHGRPAAFQALARRWHPRFLAHAYRRTADPDGAAEAVQNAWLGITRSLRSLEDPTRFRAWALRVVDRKALDWIRRRQSHRRFLNRLATESAPAQTETSRHATNGDGADPARDDEIERIRSALRRLPDESRAVLGLFYGDGLSILEIAEVLAIPDGTVKSRLFHARRRLREILESRS